INLSSHLTEPLRGQALRNAVVITLSIADEDSRAYFLEKEMTRHLSEAQLGNALLAALDALSFRRAERPPAMIHLVPHLPESLREQAWSDALRAANAVTDDK